MYHISRTQKSKAAQRFKKGDFRPYRIYRLRNGRRQIVFHGSC